MNAYTQRKVVTLLEFKKRLNKRVAKSTNSNLTAPGMEGYLCTMVHQLL